MKAIGHVAFKTYQVVKNSAKQFYTVNSIGEHFYVSYGF